MRARALLVGIGLALAAGEARADGRTASATGMAQAQVVAPLVAVREADLDFGAIFATAVPGTVMVTGAGGLAYGGGVQPACAPGACGNPHAARFAVNGEAGRAYLVSLPASVMATGTLADGGAAPALEVSELTVRSASRPGAGAGGQLDAAGRDRFEVGGTLHVPGGTPAASNRATVAVIVSYG